MLEIENIDIGFADALILENKLWESDGYHTLVYAQITYDKDGFIVRFTVEEAEPLCEKKKHMEAVHEDSCVEFFANFMPEKSNKYINFEVNALGMMNAAFRSNRNDSVPLLIEEIKSFDITAEIQNDFWRVTYKIGYDFIQKYYPGFRIENCKYIQGNFYKCGDRTKIKHYLSYFKIELEKPNFHCPEFFGKMYIENCIVGNDKYGLSGEVQLKNYYSVNFSEQREKLLCSNAANKIIDDIVSKANKAIEKEYESLKFSEYMIFEETGNRSVYEKKYFERRNDCAYVLCAYWLTENNKYKEKLIDLIYCISDEYTWCVPAHAKPLAVDEEKAYSPQIVETIDLFQAETARLFTDVAVLIGDKLPDCVNERIEYEIRRRIISAMKNRDFRWLTYKTNWSAVCAASVATALLHFGTDKEIESIRPRLDMAMEYFLSGYDDDGCCKEGCNYWNYGFGHFVIYARMICEYTKGEVNYFAKDKVKRIACYMQKIRMGETKIVSFSDADSKFTFSPGLMSFLKSIYPDDICLPPLKYGNENGNIYSIKELLWFDTDYSEDEIIKDTTFFENAEWFVCHQDKYCFAAKGGNNAEPHNHNDVGSFMVVTSDNNIPLDDIGCGEYNAQTFDINYRYSLLTNASFGHSVPIVNDKFQKYGENYAARDVMAGDNMFSLDIGGAYEEGLVDKLQRTFVIENDRIILTDSVCASNEIRMVERFISKIKPDIKDGYIDLQCAQILFDASRFVASLKKDGYKRHSNTDEITVYLIDFEPVQNNESEFRCEIIIK